MIRMSCIDNSEDVDLIEIKDLVSLAQTLKTMKQAKMNLSRTVYLSQGLLVVNKCYTTEDLLAECGI
jgi:hypothetical protein